MSDWPVIQNIDQIVISPATPQSIGATLNAMGSAINGATWPTANKAFFIPISIYAPVTIYKMFVINGPVVSGNIDVGIYDRGGGKIVSSGSTAQSGSSVVQEFDITDTMLNPGLYYLACSVDNTTSTLDVWSSSGVIGRSLGIAEQTSAFPLPSPATMAAISGTLRFPFIGATQRTVV